LIQASEFLSELYKWSVMAGTLYPVLPA